MTIRHVPYSIFQSHDVPERTRYVVKKIVKIDISVRKHQLLVKSTLSPPVVQALPWWKGHKKAMRLLVRFSSIYYYTSTLRLSTRYSFWVFIGKSNLEVSFALNMLSALIYSERSYSTMQQVATIDTPEVRPPRSSRTRGRSSQNSWRPYRI